MYKNEGVEQMGYNLYQPKIVREQVTSTHNILVVIETNRWVRSTRYASLFRMFLEWSLDRMMGGSRPSHHWLQLIAKVQTICPPFVGGLALE